ncbi:ribosomal-protein-alanine N-acetyltransferase [Enterococcus sp. PF1-24]|uniref:ribosomal protein S18-alanine N-acetyltransferase n=1 Tax=unclassified Enterococcus TaxID=2608891 RepID=UPI00247395F6|nr:MULTISPECIES: ribosomal protein S18-alanine N-acetyltransferase [unclassified Enterococcus]MDH6364967.1 ribosomal-protein-alanine N-acetyltransferase [Enterococcus sp. PFB1-1]MDH6402068.1 ribosomal-protein-alanine N-acetyltransferase [Enterococcus sp. PF1-24]
MFVAAEIFEKADLAEKLWQLSQESYTFGAPWKASQFLSDLENEHSHYLLYMEENQLVAYLGYHSFLDEGEIINVAVKKTFQGQGIAKALLNELEVKLQEKAVQLLFLEVRESNQAAQCLYQKNCFTSVALRKKYYQNPLENGIVMQKKLRKK